VLSQATKKAILPNDHVQFFWSIVCSEWEKEVSAIHGFSYASAWIEQFKQDTKMTTEKSKGLRKQLIPEKTHEFAFTL